MAYYRKELYTRESIPRILLPRLALLFGLLALTVSVLYYEREGLTDRDGTVTFLDIIYFTVTTITSVGYGDIVPLSTFARMFDTFFITAVRFTSWVIIFGTAYEVIIQRKMEEWKMKRIQKGLKDHVIVCGFDEFGKNIVKQLISAGTPPNKIAVVDPSEQAMQEVAELGAIGLRGDATMEATLEKAGVLKAKYLIAAAGRDDTNILICLTAKHMNKYVEIIGRVMESENMPLMKQSGANVVIAPLELSSRIIVTAIKDKPKYQSILKEFKY